MSRHRLGAFIAGVQAARGWSERDLEKRADGRPGLGKSNISKIKNHPLTSIKGETIRGLSELLGVDERIIGLYALESMGITPDEQPATLRDAIANEPELSERDKRILLATLNEMRMPGGGQ